jgi:aminopeptidase
VELEALERYASLIVELGANVQPGQIVELRSHVGYEPLTRAVAAAAYRRGARFVDAAYFDVHVRRARLLHADEDTLDFVPSWHKERVLQYGEQRCARIALSGLVEPGLLDDIDPARVARDRFPFIAEYFKIIEESTTNWTGACCPSEDWAGVVFPDLEPAEALERLWREVLHACRVDEPDPLAAWEVRQAELKAAKERLNAARLSALRFQGPGTDLTVGLLPGSIWCGGREPTADGILHQANIPTEEVFTAPDPARVDGHVRSTRPLQLRGGTIVTGLEVRFEGGRAVAIEAERGAESLRALAAFDEGAARLGEVALVDDRSRVGSLGTVFYTTLLDENAASHIALGDSYSETVSEEDRPRANESRIHVDFMIGGPDVDVTGVTDDGRELPLLRGGAWANG